jgi:alpha-N-arabinofuranosidase
LLTDITGDAVGFPAEAVVMKLMQTHFLDAFPILVDGDSPQRQVRGTDFVDRGPTLTGSPTYPLDVVAAFSGDRKKFLLSVVNPTEDGHNFSAKIGGIKLREPGKLYQIAPPSVNSGNEAGKEPVVKIDETEQARLPDIVLTRLSVWMPFGLILRACPSGSSTMRHLKRKHRQRGWVQPRLLLQ